MMFTIVIVLIVVLVLIYRKRSYDRFWRHIYAFPGPRTYPLIGNTAELFSDSENLFHRNRLRAKEYYPIWSVWVFYIAFVGIANPDDMEIVLTSMEHTKKSDFYDFLHRWLGQGLLTSDGDKWHSHRKLLTPGFHFSILQEFIHIFNKETKNLIKVLEGKCHQKYIDVIKPITEFTLCSVGETSLGIDFSNDEICSTYKDAIYNYIDILTYRLVRPWLHNELLYKFSDTYKTEIDKIKIMHDFSRNIIRERIKLFETNATSYTEKKRLAMLDLLLKAKQNGAVISDEEIREEVDTFMFEGHDTTSIALSYTLLALANEEQFQEEILQEINNVLKDPDQVPTYKDLCEMKFMERCIKESLRIYPSVPVIGRHAGKDIKTSTGYIIPKGTNIVLYMIDMHRNPNVWEDPEKFDPDRFLPENVATRHPFAYLPFSAGPRNCIGQKFAILEIKAALCGILRKFQLKAVDKPEDLRFKVDLVLRPAGEVRVKFIPRY